MELQNWLFLLPDGTETVVRVFAPGTPGMPPVFMERSELTDRLYEGRWSVGLILPGSGDLNGRPYERLARIEERR
jgi:hypothetical protein